MARTRWLPRDERPLVGTRTASAPEGAAGQPSWPGWHAALGEAAVVLIVGLVVAMATTWPLAAQLGSLVDNAADGPFQAWTIDHVQWALTGGGPLWDANIFAPNRNTLAYSDSLLGLAVPLLPLRAAGLNPVAQLNVALLAGMATSAGGGYLVGRVVGGGRGPAIMTGAAFAFGAFGSASTAQVHATFHVGIALAAVGAWWLADRARDDGGLVAPSVLLAGAAVWQLSVSFYPGAYALFTVLLILVVRRRDLGRRGLVAAGASLGACALGGLVLVLPYLSVLGENRDFVRSAEEVANLGVDFTAAQERSTVWGPLLGAGDMPVPAFPGVALLVLSVVGLLAGLRGSVRDRRVVVAALALTLLGAFLALGTSDEGWRSYSPYRLLFEYVPGFKVIRAAARAWVIGLLGMGLLSGIGAAAIGTRLAGVGRRRWQGAATAAVATVGAIGLVVEGYASWADKPTVEVSAVDEALADEPASGGVLYLPALVDDGLLSFATTFAQVENVYGTTAHHRRTPNGYSGLGPEEWPALSRRMQDLPSPATIEELRAIGVAFVVVRAGVQGTPWEGLAEPARAEPLQLVGRYDGDLLYRIPDG